MSGTISNVARAFFIRFNVKVQYKYLKYSSSHIYVYIYLHSCFDNINLKEHKIYLVMLVRHFIREHETKAIF